MSDSTELLAATAAIASAHLSRNQVALADVPGVLRTVHAALAGLGGPVAAPVEVRHAPAVSIKKSLSDDQLTCLECGKVGKTIKRHLAIAHGLSPTAYRQRWNLPVSYPMVTPAYSASRSALARSLGLGRKLGRSRLTAIP